MVEHILTCIHRTGRVGGEADTEPLAALVQGGVFGDTAATQIYIMTPATKDLDLTSSVLNQAASLTNGDHPALYGPVPPGDVDRITPLKTALNQLLPGVSISQFVYRRQTSGNLLTNGAYGAAMVCISCPPLPKLVPRVAFMESYSNKPLLDTIQQRPSGGSLQSRRRPACAPKGVLAMLDAGQVDGIRRLGRLAGVSRITPFNFSRATRTTFRYSSRIPELAYPPRLLGALQRQIV